MTRTTLTGSGLAVAAALLVGLVRLGAPGPPVTGLVVDDAGRPVAGAVIRVQATETYVLTGADGGFILPVEGPVRLTAWAHGFYITGGEEYRPADDVRFELHALPTSDNPGYEWRSVAASGPGAAEGCAACHSAAGTELGHTLPADEWAQDAHGRSATNHRFLTMYLGTDVAGNQSPPTRYVTNPDYGAVPLAPDPALPHHGPGYVLDFPDTAGNCGSCHLPVAAADDAYGVDPTELAGVEAEGIACDFCHKVSDVVVDPSSGVPRVNRPGVLSIELIRPPPDAQLFAGPFDDVAPGEDTYSELQTESRFCAACHHGVFWDTVVYDSYGEWLASPYADPATGKTCQDCHMPATGATVFARPEVGGNERDPALVRSHLMPGAGDPELLANAVRLDAAAAVANGEVQVDVTIVNDRTGHHVPTDSPLRHLILHVVARDELGVDLVQVDGPVLPEWCGTGDPAAGHYAGEAGTAYAKVLEEVWTGLAPSGAYWMPTRVVQDNRIAALESATSTYRFAAPASGPVELEVSLWFRRAFIELAEVKGWDDPDILMERVELVVRAG